MSLSVTHNGDGTVTVTCGGDSVTMSLPARAGTRSSDGPTLWPNDRVTASLILEDRAKTKVIDVASANDVIKAIKGQHDLYRLAAEPTLFEYRVKGSSPLEIGKIKEALLDLGDPEWMGTQIKLMGSTDE